MEVRKIHEVVTTKISRITLKILAEDVLKILDELEHREMQRDITLATFSLRLEVMRFVEKVAEERGYALKAVI